MRLTMQQHLHICHSLICFSACSNRAGSSVRHKSCNSITPAHLGYHTDQPWHSFTPYTFHDREYWDSTAVWGVTFLKAGLTVLGWVPWEPGTKHDRIIMWTPAVVTPDKGEKRKIVLHLHPFGSRTRRVLFKDAVASSWFHTWAFLGETDSLECFFILVNHSNNDALQFSPPVAA